EMVMFFSNKRFQFRQTVSLRPLQALGSLRSWPSVQNFIDLPRTRLNSPVRHEPHCSSGKWCRLFLVGSERVDDLLRHGTSQFVKDYLADQVLSRDELQIPWSMIVHFKSYPCDKPRIDMRPRDVHCQPRPCKAALPLNVGSKPSWDTNLFECEPEDKLSWPERKDRTGEALVAPGLGY